MSLAAALDLLCPTLLYYQALVKYDLIHLRKQPFGSSSSPWSVTFAAKVLAQ